RTFPYGGPNPGRAGEGGPSLPHQAAQLPRRRAGKDGAGSDGPDGPPRRLAGRAHRPRRAGPPPAEGPGGERDALLLHSHRRPPLQHPPSLVALIERVTWWGSTRCSGKEDGSPVSSRGTSIDPSSSPWLTRWRAPSTSG